MNTVCKREYECNGQCLLNLVAGHDTWSKYSKLCSGSIKEQKFWNDIISDGVKPSEETINNFIKQRKNLC